jgi:hypothetical protein
LDDLRPGRLGLVLVLLVAALLRLWHYDFDVGHAFEPDAPDKIGQARAVAEGDLVPLNWKQPYFLPYSAGALLAAVGAVAPVDDALAKRVMTLYMIALALGTIALVHRTAVAAGESAGVALVAAALLAVVPLDVVGSRYIKEDIPLMFWCQAALLFTVLVVERGRPRDHVAAGLTIGAAVATKWTGALLAPLFVAACLLRRTREPDPAARGELAGWAMVGLALIPSTALALNPMVLIRSDDFLAALRFQSQYSLSGHHDGTRVTPWAHLWTFYLRRALVPGLTLPVTAAFLAGCALLARRGRRAGLVLVAAWAAIDYLAFEASPAKPYPFFARYLHPMTPAAVLLAAVALGRLRAALATRLAARTARLVAGAACAATIAVPLATTVAIDAGLGDDTRLQARRWIEANLPPGARMVLDGANYSPPLHEPPQAPGRRPAEVAVTLHRWRLDAIDYVVLTSFRWERFEAGGSLEAERARQFYRTVRTTWTLVKEVRPRLAVQTYGFHNPVIGVYRAP